MAKNRGFTVVMALILTLGIGANTTVFTLVNGLFFGQPAEVRAPHELVRINRFADGIPTNGWTYPDYVFFRENSTALAGLAAYTQSGRTMTASLGELSISARVSFVSDNYFDVLGVQPESGRTFSREENESPGYHPVAIVSHGFWQRIIGDMPIAATSRISINGHPCTIIGVAPKDFRGISPVEESPDLWVPIVLDPILAPSRMDRLNRVEGSMVVWLQVVARLRPGVALAAAQSNLDAIATALAEEVPDWRENHEGAEILPDYRFSPHTGTRLVGLAELLVAVVAVVLAIACANAALLLMARASTRRKDIAVCLALGASRGRIVRQLLVEGMMLAAVGGVGGFLLSFWSAGLAAQALPYKFNTTFNPDLRVLMATFGVVVMTALFFATVPALRASQTEIASVLQHGRLGGGRSRLREGLVVAQIALAVVLVAGAALFVRSLRAATSVDLGFASENRLAISINLAQHGYGTEEARDFTQNALREIATVPAVRRATTAMQLPFRGMMRLAMRAEGSPAEEEIEVGLNFVGPGYLETMGVSLIRGREFRPDDREGMPPVAVINEAAAKRLWPDGAALGRSLDLMGQSRLVVGVAGNTRFNDLGEDPGPFVYLPMLQTGATSLSFIVEAAAAAPQAALKPVGDVIRTLDSRVVLTNFETIADIVDGVVGPFRVGATLVGIFAGVALLLAAIGLYGALSYLVVQRTRIIGIRMALGATSRRVAQAVMARGLILSAIGIPIGMVVAWASARLIQGFLFQIEAQDSLSFLAVPVVVVATICLASWLPARSAARLDPVVTLREE